MDRQNSAETYDSGLDRTDLAIIEVLRKQGRISNEKLSALVHLTPRPCSERVRRLERSGVIRGYRAHIDVRAVFPGISIQVLVALSNQSGRTAQRAFEECVKECSNIVGCQLITGTFDYILQMRCTDLEQYRVLSEQWLEREDLHIDKLVALPTLAEIKGADGL
ncbi:AsnC family transcriptional regulator [Pseudomonas syringae pv. tomato]|jgi:Lrp/AsnC family leucine-responsive transcriptional regulator|uniref:AsnC family transcriptional regulator n=1 Tax=Pseudomonas syringae pv. tomato TaxID=323 RepID=A0AB36KNC0_PSEUB|nr:MULTISPECIES: Lrp/AsnC family transcriptional regulator [Pseudomonas]MBI6846227.1 Lrp/AsnC family transcriptional regulator [Pseudomonas syringae]MBX6512132.1 Lrp/AsnC family transcriptional regulator [Pseudomonas syringae pv. tomato]OPE58246.1 AsnC family transcriptional regulator [Pseudomonas syringae pv. tomato]TES56410.1 Lrp/AsnC family transcriptional regulator [Pseudomonas syringae pv. tomato]TES76156.1 Lrp/AsnC family transcriptional regulator [Pseudomonas syringae pv. tomato]